MELALKFVDLSSESDSDEEFEHEILEYLVLSNKKDKSDYIKKRKSHGEFILTKEFSDEKFTNYFRMNREQFKEVHDLIKEKINSHGCNASKPIETEEKLAVFLRYLASGNSYKTMAYSYRMGDRTVSNIVKEVSVAIWESMQPSYMPEPTEEMWLSSANDFKDIWQFPHCIGAIDGKHVVIKKPGMSGSSFFNYKKNFSVVLMAVVDAKYKFLIIDVGSKGRFSDGNIFASSVLGKKLNNGTLRIPAPTPILPNENAMPYVFVGDEAFPLSINLMRPFPSRSTLNDYEKKVFNYRLSRARQTVECAFGILSSRFRVFRIPFEIKVSSVVSVTKAACVLHNYLRCNQNTTIDILPIVKQPFHQLKPFLLNRNRTASVSFQTREYFTLYFNTVGSVPWQRECVAQGKY